MTFQTIEDLDHQITRIDTGMMRDELAACYLIQGADEFAVIDTGTNRTVPVILGLLEQRGIDRSQVRYVIPTHVHLDHAGGVGGLMQALPEATLLIHPRGARHMIDPSKLKDGVLAVYGEKTFAEVYEDIIPVPEARVRTLDDGAEIQLGDRRLLFLDTPGHARHHFCIHDARSSGIFTGDTFGLCYPPLATEKGPFIFPTTTPVQFDPEPLKRSIRRLLALEPERVYLTHYGMVENPQSLGKRLLTVVDDFVALAEAVEEQAAPDQMEDALTAAMKDYLFRGLREHGCHLDDDRLMTLIGMDIRLNSQGLMVWLQQRSAG
ncbi:MBL fold metallo-hydrolase [Marinobacter halodurans]|uniref:MBL fold metallo-hydrolase n=1 Tax=Marinobacter halodurans TaxID=2528979 RepID=A0ABY1ZFQ6_9GAMM|nr:MBL fold metallo-hydrolase [Marinobacter halodurans]TBW49377.1 MBL fold metallo-hydrolase [Marinobacter halodurans]